MLKLEREAAATMKISTPGVSTVYSWCVILITQHAPFSRRGLFQWVEWISANVLQVARVYWRVPVLFYNCGACMLYVVCCMLYVVCCCIVWLLGLSSCGLVIHIFVRLLRCLTLLTTDAIFFFLATWVGGGYVSGSAEAVFNPSGGIIYAFSMWSGPLSLLLSKSTNYTSNANTDQPWFSPQYLN